MNLYRFIFYSVGNKNFNPLAKKKLLAPNLQLMFTLFLIFKNIDTITVEVHVSNFLKSLCHFSPQSGL